MMVRQGFEPGDRDSLARLYWAAFGGKLGRVLGPERRALDFVARVANPERALCVHDGDRLVGVAGFHAGGLALVGGGMTDLAAVYGWHGAAWRRRRCRCSSARKAAGTSSWTASSWPTATAAAAWARP